MRGIQFYEKLACKRCKKYFYTPASSTKMKIMLFVEDKSDLGESNPVKTRITEAGFVFQI